MPHNILIVDDSRSMRRVIRKVLDLSGLRIGECIEAGNGREALDVLESQRIDLVLTNIHMPVMDGLRFFRLIRSSELRADLPVVFVTAESREDFLREVMALGAKGCIRKPFKPEEMRSLLCELIGESNGEARSISDEGCDF